MLRNADGGGVVTFSRKKRYKGVRFNVISVTRGWVGVNFPEKKALRNTGMAPKPMGILPVFSMIIKKVVHSHTHIHIYSAQYI